MSENGGKQNVNGGEKKRKCDKRRGNTIDL